MLIYIPMPLAQRSLGNNILTIFLFLITNPVAFRTMGIVVSLPRIEGLVTVSSLSSATYPSSSMSGLANSGVTATTILNEHGEL